jgi:hypothetical protein
MRAVAALTPQFNMNVEYGKPDDDYLVELDSFVYISRGEIEVVQETIVKRTVRKVQGYIVKQAVLIRGGCLDQDVTDILDNSEHVSIAGAIQAAVLLVAKSNIDGALQCVNESMYWEENKDRLEREEQVWAAM